MPLVLALIALAAVTTAARPDGLPTPQKALVSVVAHGEGVQIYTCQGGAWTLTAPEATLTDAQGRRIGRHYAGPSWQATDGGVVTGQVIAKTPSPAGDGIDWLLLRATSAPAQGLFANVGYIERQKTAGGRAPAGGCDAAHEGQAVRVAYSAEYDFYTPTK
jgi:hypothetical protein